MSQKASKTRRACLFIPLGLVGLIVLLIAASALSNLGLPQHSTTLEQLSELEKARLSEAVHLRKALGDDVWPDWSQSDIPIIVYNERYAFLVGYPNPPDGWRKVPSLEARGGPWEQVPGDSFEGQPYYRTPILDPNKTPQSFTVLVGDKWVATFMTREYSQIEFYRSFRQDLPPIISNVVPVRLIWAFMMGKTDSYIAALEHESFHSFEGQMAVDTFNASEQMYSVEAGYPYDAMEAPWRQEMDVLLQAIQAPTDSEAIGLAQEFVQFRASRRAALTSDQVDLECLREWEEGLAKYTELEITRLADTNVGYAPVEAITLDRDFKNYQGQQQFWASQLNEAAKTQGRSGDTRFYYSGNALAVLLDRLAPGWKSEALPGGANLDALLQYAVK
jgi:hypothetical protein